MPRPLTRVENLLKAIAAISEDPQIDALTDEALAILKPRDKRTDKLDPSKRRRSRKAAKKAPSA